MLEKKEEIFFGGEGDREVVGGGAGGAIAPPIFWDFAPIHYLLNKKIPIYCLPLQSQFSDYLPAK